MYVRSPKSVNAAQTGRGDMSTARVCQAYGCSKMIRPGMLMCLDCWRQLPEPLQCQVTRTLADYMEGRATVRPYLIARLEAIIHVSKSRGAQIPELEAGLAHRKAGPQ